MLDLESVYWASEDKEKLIKTFSGLGFQVTSSMRANYCQSIFFGPESIEIFSNKEKPELAGEKKQVDSGVVAIGFESDHIASDYRRIKNLANDIQKPYRGKGGSDNIPLWTGFNLPSNVAPAISGSVVMNSPQCFEKLAKEQLPVAHGNTCFGIEGVHLFCADPQDAANQWARVLSRNPAGLKWNELAKTSGKRFQVGHHFFDVLATKSGSQDGVFMLTLKVADLEKAKSMSLAAGAEVLPCENRDGFIISPNFTGGIALRMVRTYWKRYLPPITKNFPYGRRTDHFRPLGGANSTTLNEGFDDNWKY